MTDSSNVTKVFICVSKPNNFWLDFFLVLTIFALLCGIQYWLSREYFLIYILPITLGFVISNYFSARNYEKFFAQHPYLTLDAQGLTIQTPSSYHYIKWADVREIDLKLTVNSPSYHFIATTQEYRIDRDLLGEKLQETIVLLKRYAEKYGTAKFIY